MQVDSTTSITLQRYKGDNIRVNGEDVDPGAGGLALAPSDNLLAADGTDSGGNMAPSTLYYVYVSNASASFAPTDLRASTTGPSLLNGVKYLATTGNGANWRFVGWIRTNASGADGEFVSDTTNRHCINYYNRRPLPILLCPNYADDNASTTYTFNSASWARINGGTADTASYISNGEDAVLVSYQVGAEAITAHQYLLALGDNSTTTGYCQARNSSTEAGGVPSRSLSVALSPAEGYRTLVMLMLTTTTFTVYADAGRGGGSADVRLTYMSATVMG